MEALLSTLHTTVLGLPVWEWLLLALLSAALTTTVLALRRVAGHVLGRLSGTDDDQGVDDLVVSLVGALHPVPVILWSAALAATVVELPDTADRWIQRIAMVGVVVQGTAWALMLVRRGGALARSRPPGASHASLVRALVLIGQLTVWATAALFLLDALGLDVSTIIAGLGVGGIAVALAAKSMLEDLFAALSILIDRPFEDGEFIEVGEFSGTVETVGLRSTRIRSLQGEELVFSNRDLLSARLRNYGRMSERRVVLEFGVTYDTSAEDLEVIPAIVEEAVGDAEPCRFERCHFAGFGDSSLDFVSVFWVEVPDYVAMMDARQEVNLAVVQSFEDRGIAFAFPTRTLRMGDDGGGAGDEDAGREVA